MDGAISTVRAWRRHRRDRPRDAGQCPSSSRSCGRSQRIHRTTGRDRGRVARPTPASRASARIWRRCWATCSTTPASGRAVPFWLSVEVPSEDGPRPGPAIDDHGYRRRAGPYPSAARANRKARPAPRRDQARLGSGVVNRHGSRAVLSRVLRARAGPARRTCGAPHAACSVISKGLQCRPDSPQRGLYSAMRTAHCLANRIQCGFR